MFSKALSIILKCTNFKDGIKELENLLLNINKDEIIELLAKVSVIPEQIKHDSSEEKLFSKFSDIVLSKALCFLGLKSKILEERSDSADVYAFSEIYGYSLVGDAKSFRLSRTAKNQKDFKINSLSEWKGDSDFSILVSPYFQYPKNKSQIYKQALDNNVALLSFELLSFLIKNDIKETKILSLKPIWDISNTLNGIVLNKDSKNCFFDLMFNYLSSFFIKEKFYSYLITQKISLIDIANKEICFYQEEIKKIENYSKDEAIKELIMH